MHKGGTTFADVSTMPSRAAKIGGRTSRRTARVA